MIDNALKAVSMTEDELVVENYIVLFGGRDAEFIKNPKTGVVDGNMYANPDGSLGDYFSAESDLESEYTKSGKLDIDWEHGSQPAESPKDIALGFVDWSTLKIDGIGAKVKRILFRRNHWIKLIEPLIELGLIGNSSEATETGVEKSADGHIIKWPLYRDTLTVTPTEPRMLMDNPLALQAMKSLAKVYPDLEASILEAEKDTATDDATDKGEQAETISDSSTREGANMSDEKDKVDAVTHEEIDELTGQVKAMSDSMEKVLKWVDDQPAINDGGVQVVQAEEDRKFATFGEQLIAVKNASMEIPVVDPRLLGLNAKDMAAQDAKTTIVRLNETIGAQGGFLVQEDFGGQITRQTYETGQLVNRVRKVPVGPNANGLTAWAVNETARATGSRFGGVQSYWTGEAADKTRSKPTFKEVSLRLRKLTAICRATDEVLQDTIALENIIRESFAGDFAWMIDDAIYNGLGGFQPLGVMNGGSLVSVGKEVGQAADTIVTENIVKMYSRRLGPAGAYSWFINQDIEPQLYSLTLDVGTGGMPVYLPPGGLSDAPYGRLMGLPVIPLEHTATVGTTGDIMLADFNQYIMIDKGPTEVATSIHVYFISDETAFRFVIRVDGQPIDVAPITPANSALTQSAFVVLDSRD